MKQGKPVLHGRDHSPGGADPIPLPTGGGGPPPWSMPGVLATFTGSERWYAQFDGEIDYVHLAVGVAPTGASGVTVRLNKNGSSLGTGNIAASGFEATFTPSPATFTAGDYFTVDVTTVGGTIAGSSLVVQLVLV